MRGGTKTHPNLHIAGTQIEWADNPGSKGRAVPPVNDDVSAASAHPVDPPAALQMTVAVAIVERPGLQKTPRAATVAGTVC
jgi:hypothetical protein